MPKTLLLADDSVVIQKLVGLSFANEDVELVTADNGDDAIALAGAQRPDVVIADVIMPGKSGYEVCEAIKADPELAQIPVLLLTGTFEAFDEERSQAVGSAGHITKPFEAQALVERVNALFAHPAPAAPVEPTPAPAPPLEATPASAPPAPSETTADSAFDFFEDDVSDLSRDDSDSLAPDPLADAQEIAEPLGADLDAGLLGSDSTVALMPDDPEGLGAELPEGLVELEPDSETPDASATVLAEDLFDAPAEDDSDWLAPPAETTPAAAETVVTDFETDGGDATSMPPAVDATVLADDLFDSPPAETVLEAELADEATSAPDMTLPPEPGSAAEAFADPGEPAVGLDPPASPSSPASDFDISASDLGTPLGSDHDAVAGPAPGSHGLETGSSVPSDAITAALRERVHETLEKVAWEAFSELSEQVVRQVLERVETIAWEVIPQMTETMIREEIARMKGENES